jgi:hypothetical protein
MDDSTDTSPHAQPRPSAFGVPQLGLGWDTGPSQRDDHLAALIEARAAVRCNDSQRELDSHRRRAIGIRPCLRFANGVATAVPG